jgi:phosphoribosylaminoimidazolecarboxamide formyltransferase / IMP cyclohydrolase
MPIETTSAFPLPDAPSPSTYTIRRALLSVSDKTGIVDFAQKLAASGIEIISTGGTATTLREAGVAVRSVADLTHFPEMLDGRVKTLHPTIHAALLAVLDNPQHVQQLEANMIQPIDLVVVNLYPFEKTLENSASTHEDIVENIDIGGPAMIRSAAKNYRWTAVVTNPDQYDALWQHLERSACTLDEAIRLDFAREAFAHTAYYDSVIAAYFTGEVNNALTEPVTDFAPTPTLTLALRKEQELRYGENPHQQAALYTSSGKPGSSYGSIFQQLHGKELSYNNILDIDAAAKLALEFVQAETLVGNSTVVIVKHTNPCGVGSAPTLSDAYRSAYACDTTSAFGGIITFTSKLDLATAREVDEIFTEVLIAPSFAPDALELLQQKKNRRLMTVNFDALQAAQLLALEAKAIAGGMLLQSADTLLWNTAELRVVTHRQPTDNERRAMEYAWRVAKHVKSNAIVYAASDRTLAIGAGQMSRVDSAIIAARKATRAGIDLKGCAVASDAFFPFADGLLEAVENGATAVIQPGGSVRDEEVIAAANERGITMMLTGVRHFRH